MSDSCPQRHPIHWHNDGSIVLQVENTLYCIHLSILQQISPVFNDIFTIPRTTEDPKTHQEVEESPILLEQIKKEEFDDFLLWIYCVEWSAPSTRPERAYIHLLKLCQLWQIDAGIKYAVYHLEKEYMSPVRRIELARKFSLHHWVRPAMKELMMCPLSSISEEDTHQLGFKEYTIVARAREALENERKLISAYAPPMTFEQSWECTNHELSCRNTWRDFWWKRVARQILHPTKPIAFGNVVRLLENSDRDLKAMAPGCKEEIIDSVRQRGFNDGEIFESAVEAVVTYHKSL